TIRTALLRDGVAYVQAGGGIVADSQDAAEALETVNKAAAPLRAVYSAQRLQVFEASAAKAGETKGSSDD
ncbi:chorismate-binding protein, partial [Escherichia coli]|nr:chorismate-binding protein [Escherichia coli]